MWNLSAGVRSRATIASLLLTVLIVAACGARPRPPLPYPSAGPGTNVPAGGALRVGVEGAVREVPLEEYVAGCVLAELGAPRVDPAAARRVRQVQAILCRSYGLASRGRHAAAGFDVCATTHCQVFRQVPDTDIGRLARAAAEETRGIVLLFDGHPVRPPYHAACGGRTSPAHQVWPGAPQAWLPSVADEGCERTAAWSWTVERSHLERALRAGGHEGFGPPLQAVEVAVRDAARRASSVRLVGRATELMSGDEFRTTVTRALGASSLPSTLFSVRRDGGRLIFDGRGSGHGVGLCQAGAMRLALRDRTPREILRHYYPGTSLGPFPAAASSR
jgi:stage II sporulation protein D